MRVLLFVVGVFLMTSLSTATHAEDYYLVTSAPDGLSTIFIDTTSLVHQKDGTVTAWLTEVFLDGGIVKGVKYQSEYYRFSCENSTSQMLSATGYDVNDKNVFYFNEDQAVNRFPPGTVGDLQLRTACDLSQLGTKQPVHDITEMRKAARTVRAIATGKLFTPGTNDPY